MLLFLSTVSTSVTVNDLKGYTFTHPTVAFPLYDLFTEEDIEESIDLQNFVTSNDVIIQDSFGNNILDLNNTSPMLQSTYDNNNDGKIDPSASQVESVNGQTGIVVINEPDFSGTSAVAGANSGSVVDDGIVATGNRALFDDGTFKNIYKQSSNYRSEFINGYVYSGATLDSTYYIFRENLSGVEVATNVTDLETDWINKEILVYT